MNGIEKMLFNKIKETIKKESEKAEEFAIALLVDDKLNAHFQDGRSSGLKQALILLEGMDKI